MMQRTLAIPIYKLLLCFVIMGLMLGQSLVVTGITVIVLHAK